MDAEFGEDFAGVEAEVSGNPIAFLQSGVILRVGIKGGCQRSDCKCERKKQLRHVLPPRFASPRDAQKRCRSLDHLVGAGEQRWRDFELERFGGLHIDHQVELGGPVDWQVARRCAFEDSSGIESSPAICVENIVSITDQTAGHRDLTVRSNQRKVRAVAYVLYHDREPTARPPNQYPWT